MKRGYLNASTQTASNGSPYVDLSYSEAKLAAYTETGGGFPARFDSRTDKATELRVGTNAVKPLVNDLKLVGLLEGVHRFEKDGARTSGQMIGLFAFNLDGLENQQGWRLTGKRRSE